MASRIASDCPNEPTVRNTRKHAHTGGCDDTLANEASGALAEMIDEAFLSRKA